MLKTSSLLLALAFAGLAADFPQAEIVVGSTRAKLYLPDTEKGYYRATRFDWSGQIASLEAQGHNYFGQWFESYDPKLHDAILGPVEEFLTDGMGLGYKDVKVGESFVKIGVGAVRKPEERAFQQFKTYEITDPGKWTVKPYPDRVEFTQELHDTAGYAYIYKKTVRLTKGKPRLVLEHSLKNTGTKVIESSVYEHNFFMIDDKPAGPDYSVKFPFTVTSDRDLKGLAEARGDQFAYLKEFEKGQSVYAVLSGFGATPKDYDIRVENRAAQAGVRQTSDRPLAKLAFWSIRSTVCPEAYIDMRIEPGKEFTWRIAYDFYTIPASQNTKPQSKKQ
jgi:hypothetical protein